MKGRHFRGVNLGPPPRKPNRIRLGTAGILLLGGVFLISPADAGNPPDWVLGGSQKYPNALFLIGVGFADTRAGAEDRAYAAIAKIFLAEIRSKTQEWERYLQSDSKGRSEDRRELGIEQATQVSTQKVLENVRIAESWLDGAEAVYYVLAVMDRRHAASALRDRITALDLRVEESLRQARGTDEKLKTVRALRGAVRALLLREADNVQLRVVSPDGKGSEGGRSLSEVGQELREFLTSHFRIRVEVEEAHRERIRAVITEGLNRQGFAVSAAGPGPTDLGADLEVRGSVRLEPVEMPQRGPKPMQFVRWSASFKLTDAVSKQVIGSVNKQGREGHLTAAEAESRALRVAESELVGEIGRQMAEFIYGGEEP